MNYREIRERVADEIALQDSMDNRIGERWLPMPPGTLLTAEEHTKMYLPRLDVQNFNHSIVVETPAELADVFDAASELAGGRYLGKDATVVHESEHADGARGLGQSNVRFLAHLAVGAPFTLPDGRTVRRIAITPSTLLEDVRTSRLGIGIFLAFPADTADASADTARIKVLGYRDANEVIAKAESFNNLTRSQTYPIPRSVR